MYICYVNSCVGLLHDSCAIKKEYQMQQLNFVFEIHVMSLTDFDHYFEFILGV